MSLKYNDQTVSNIQYQNLPVKEVKYNNTAVWSRTATWHEVWSGAQSIALGKNVTSPSSLSDCFTTYTLTGTEYIPVWATQLRCTFDVVGTNIKLVNLNAEIKETTVTNVTTYTPQVSYTKSGEDFQEHAYLTLSQVGTNKVLFTGGNYLLNVGTLKITGYNNFQLQLTKVEAYY